MAARKPKLMMMWVMQRVTTTLAGVTKASMQPRVNWKLVGANGETMCQSNQGFRDKTDAIRNLRECGKWLLYVDGVYPSLSPRVVGPGRRPNVNAAGFINNKPMIGTVDASHDILKQVAAKQRKIGTVELANKAKAEKKRLTTTAMLKAGLK